MICTWWSRCQHEHLRCVHGDEIIAMNYARALCVDCGRPLPDLPAMCSVTGQIHPSKELEG